MTLDFSLFRRNQTKPLSFFLSLSLFTETYIFKHASSSGEESLATFGAAAAVRDELVLPKAALFFSSNFRATRRTRTTGTISTSSSSSSTESVLHEREKVVHDECDSQDWSNGSSRGIRTTENRRDRVFRHAEEPSRTVERTSSESRRSGRGREERAL